MTVVIELNSDSPQKTHAHCLGCDRKVATVDDGFMRWFRENDIEKRKNEIEDVEGLKSKIIPPDY
jgi:hypothetical protein